MPSNEPKRKPRQTYILCGTQPGYKIHIQKNEYPCQPCSTANADAIKASRIRHNRVKYLMIPVDLLHDWLWEDGSVLADHLPDIVVQAIRERGRRD